MRRDPSVPLSRNHHLLRWVEKMKELTSPAQSTGWTGRRKRTTTLLTEMQRAGTLLKLNQEIWPGCYYARSRRQRRGARRTAHVRLLAVGGRRGSRRTTGMNPYEMRRKLKDLFNGAMQGRTMYVLPFSMGIVGSPMSQVGVQLTDSPYVVVSMRIMARIGLQVFEEIDRDVRRVVPCMHSVGAPLAPGQQDVPWPCNDDKYIVHFPETREIWSYGSGYGGNALLGKKCFGLRIASNIARDNRWMAEHMLILGIEDPQGEKTYIAAAFPSACGKTNLAMLIPPEGLRDWKVTIVGDDIAWIKPDDDGRLRAINPEAGVFGVAPGHVGLHEPERDGDDREEHHLHERRADARRRRLVGRDDGGAAGRVPRLAGATAGRRRSAGRPASRRRIRMRDSPRRWPEPDHRPRVRRTRTACRSARSSSAAGAPRPCRWSTRPSTGPPASTSARPWDRRRRRRRSEGSATVRRDPDGDAAVLRLSHGRLLPPLDQDAAVAATRPRRSST